MSSSVAHSSVKLIFWFDASALRRMLFISSANAMSMAPSRRTKDEFSLSSTDAGMFNSFEEHTGIPDYTGSSEE
jgi:hypothetical protein